MSLGYMLRHLPAPPSRYPCLLTCILSIGFVTAVLAMCTFCLFLLFLVGATQAVGVFLLQAVKECFLTKTSNLSSAIACAVFAVTLQLRVLRTVPRTEVARMGFGARALAVASAPCHSAQQVAALCEYSVALNRAGHRTSVSILKKDVRTCL